MARGMVVLEWHNVRAKVLEDWSTGSKVERLGHTHI